MNYNSKQNRIALIVWLLCFWFVNVYAGSACRFSFETPDITDSDSVFAVVDVKPQFPGGNEAKMQFLQEHLSYPKEAQDKKLQGKVIVQFVVTKTGKVSKAKIVKSVAQLLDNEALRIVNSFPDWIPGELNGRKVSTYQLIPVTFRVEENPSRPENPKLVFIDNIRMPLNFDVNLLNPTEIDTGYLKRPTTVQIKKQLIDKYGTDAETGLIEIYTKRYKKIKQKEEAETIDTIPRINPDDENAVYEEIDLNERPIFPGGKREMMSFIYENLKYPDACKQEGIQGTVIVQFIVDKSGKIRDAVVKNKVHPLLAAEAIRVINMIPDLIPGEKHGKKVNVRFSMPFKFSIAGFIYPSENSINSDSEIPADRQLVVLDGKLMPYGFDLNWLNMLQIKSYKLMTPKNGEEEREFKLKFGPNSSRGVFMAYSNDFSEKSDMDGNIIFDVVEQMPQFPGGKDELSKFISSNLVFPERLKKLKLDSYVIVRFVVNSKGKIEGAEILKGQDEELNKEALRVINLMPQWIPGKQNGKNVSVRYYIPMGFKYR